MIFIYLPSRGVERSVATLLPTQRRGIARHSSGGGGAAERDLLTPGPYRAHRPVGLSPPPRWLAVQGRLQPRGSVWGRNAVEVFVYAGIPVRFYQVEGSLIANAVKYDVLPKEVWVQSTK